MGFPPLAEEEWDFLTRNGTALSRLGLRALRHGGYDQLIDCGAYGCVFDVGGGRVVKTVRAGQQQPFLMDGPPPDVCEAGAAAWLRFEQQHGRWTSHVFPRVYKAYRLKGGVAVFREGIGDAPAWARGVDLSGLFWELINAAYIESRGDFLDRLEPHRTFLDAHPETWGLVNAVLIIHTRLTDAGLFGHDVNGTNMGVRDDGQFVLRDFGGIFPDLRRPAVDHRFWNLDRLEWL